MPKIAWISALCVVAVLATGFTPPHHGKTGRFLKRHGFMYIPGQADGMNHDFYMQAYEISNENYRYFLNDLQIKGRYDELRIAGVDTAQWDAIFGDSSAYSKFYFQHEAYDHYPVINISYEGALMYCKWLTEAYSLRGFNIEVRLPDSTEWKIAARGGEADNTYGWGKDSYISKQGYYRCNAKKGDTCSLTLTPVMAYTTNRYGLYNMSGNTTEMLLEKGKHKGGGWNSPEPNIRIDGPDDYAGISGPSPFIGFRPIAIIHDEKTTAK